MSSILHGEQGALSLSASLCHILRDPGAQEYAANQTREEARHVTAFSQYIQARWGKPRAGRPGARQSAERTRRRRRSCGRSSSACRCWSKASRWAPSRRCTRKARDPLLRQTLPARDDGRSLPSQIRKDLGRPHDPQAIQAEHELIEDWAAQVFQVLLFNLGSPDQKTWIYQAVGLDPGWCQAAFMEAMTDARSARNCRNRPTSSACWSRRCSRPASSPSARAAIYAAYIDMAELYAEGDRMVGDDIAEEGIKYLMKLNGGNRSSRRRRSQRSKLAGQPANAAAPARDSEWREVISEQSERSRGGSSTCAERACYVAETCET